MHETIRELISEEQVNAKIRELGEQISRDYEGKTVHLVCILKGACFFMCELAKRITVPVSMDFMTVSSYGSGTKSSGIVRIKKDLDDPIDGLDVIIVEDIVDSGRPSAAWLTWTWTTQDLRSRTSSWSAMEWIMIRDTGISLLSEWCSSLRINILT